jgi:hypothetical protein
LRGPDVRDLEGGRVRTAVQQAEPVPHDLGEGRAVGVLEPAVDLVREVVVGEDAERPRPPGPVARDDLRDEHLPALPGAGVLDDVRAQVVGLHQPGQRPTLPQRRDIPGGRDVAQHPSTSSGRSVRSSEVSKPFSLIHSHRSALRKKAGPKAAAAVLLTQPGKGVREKPLD